MQVRRGAREIAYCSLMSKPHYLVVHEVTANHAFRQALLILLINHSATGEKIRLAPLIEFAECYFFFGRAT